MAGFAVPVPRLLALAEPTRIARRLTVGRDALKDTARWAAALSLTTLYRDRPRCFDTGLDA